MTAISWDFWPTPLWYKAKTIWLNPRILQLSQKFSFRWFISFHKIFRMYLRDNLQFPFDEEKPRYPQKNVIFLLEHSIMPNLPPHLGTYLKEPLKRGRIKSFSDPLLQLLFNYHFLLAPTKNKSVNPGKNTWLMDFFAKRATLANSIARRGRRVPPTILSEENIIFPRLLMEFIRPRWTGWCSILFRINSEYSLNTEELNPLSLHIQGGTPVDSCANILLGISATLFGLRDFLQFS